MNFELVPLKLDHLLAVGETDVQQNRFRMNGPGLCLLVDGEPVAMGGIMHMWGRVGKAWTLQTEKAASSKLTMRKIHGIAKTQLPLFRSALNLERLEAETLSQPKYCSWLSRLGFIFEGDMAKYRDGETYARFSWVR